MTAISALNNFSRIELPGIPEPLLNDAVRKTLQEFFRKSEAWRVTATNLLDWGVSPEQFPPGAPGIPATTRIHRIDQIKFARDGISFRRIPFTTRAQLDRSLPNWEVKTDSTPKSWLYDGLTSPRIVPMNNTGAVIPGSIQLRLIITPDDTMTNLPDVLFSEYEEHLRNGILARLMKIPGKDWTNFSGASAYASLFKAGIKDAKSTAEAEFGTSCREVMYGGL